MKQDEINKLFLDLHYVIRDYNISNESGYLDNVEVIMEALSLLNSNFVTLVSPNRKFSLEGLDLIRSAAESH